MKKIKCDKCEKMITANNYIKHGNVCGKEKKRNIFVDKDWLVGEDKYKCPYCDKIFSKNGISTHILRKHTNPELFENCYKLNYDEKNEKYVSWNKGLTKDTDDRVRNNGESLKKGIESGVIIPYWKGKNHTVESKIKISKKLSMNNNGGKCKWFDYIKVDGNIMKLQGTWEVRFAKVLDIIDEKWIKIGVGYKEHSFIWNDGERDHYYTPDFYSPKLNKYFEVKGYWWGEDKNKMNQVMSQNEKIKIEIIMKNELIEYEKLIR